MENDILACEAPSSGSGHCQKPEEDRQSSTLPKSNQGSIPEPKKGEKNDESKKYSDERSDLKLKFNTSEENLRPFISSSNKERYRSVSTRLPKPSKSAACLQTHRFHHNSVTQKEGIVENTKSETQRQSQVRKTGQELSQDSDLSRILSNQILHHIQQKGINARWADIEEKKSEEILTEKSEDIQEVDELFDHFSDRKDSRRASMQGHSQFYLSQTSEGNSFVEGNSSIKNLSDEHCYSGLKNNRSFSGQYENENSYEKNFSYASTIEPFSVPYYPVEMYQTQSYGHSHGLRSMPSSIFPSNEFDITEQGLGNDPRTTLMIRNIPNKYTIQYLSEEIDKDFGNYYDFLYLPCDTKSGANQGYGFINFLDLDAIKRFYEKFHNKKWNRFRSEKICNLTYARLQGIESLIEHFQNSKVLNHKEKKFQPIIKSLPQIHNLIRNQQNNSEQRRN